MASPVPLPPPPPASPAPAVTLPPDGGEDEYQGYIWVTKTTQMQTFRKLIEAIQSVLRDAHIEISEEGLTLRDVDPLHNCCIEIQLNSFEEHYAMHKFVIAVDLQQLHTCLRHGSGELLILSVLTSHPDKICVEFVNMAKQKKSRHWIPLRKIVAQKLTISVRDMPRVVQMPNNDFQRIIREIAPVAKSKLLYIRSESNYLVMGTEYDKLAAETEIHPKPNGMIWVANDVTMEPESFTNYYYIRYLERFCKNQLDRTVRISLARDQPLILQYPVGHLGRLFFYLGTVGPEEVERLSSSSLPDAPPSDGSATYVPPPSPSSSVGGGSVTTPRHHAPLRPRRKPRQTATAAAASSNNKASPPLSASSARKAGAGTGVAPIPESYYSSYGHGTAEYQSDSDDGGRRRRRGHYYELDGDDDVDDDGQYADDCDDAASDLSV